MIDDPPGRKFQQMVRETGLVPDRATRILPAIMEFDEALRELDVYLRNTIFPTTHKFLTKAAEVSHTEVTRHRQLLEDAYEELSQLAGHLQHFEQLSQATCGRLAWLPVQVDILLAKISASVKDFSSVAQLEHVRRAMDEITDKYDHSTDAQSLPQYQNLARQEQELSIKVARVLPVAANNLPVKAVSDAIFAISSRIGAALDALSVMRETLQGPSGAGWREKMVSSANGVNEQVMAEEVQLIRQ
jgi:hypothetical protein